MIHKVNYYRGGRPHLQVRRPFPTQGRSPRKDPMHPQPRSAAIDRHYGPPLLIPVLAYVALFAASLFNLLQARGMFPTPFHPFADKLDYFVNNATAAHLSGFLQFAGAIPLLVFTGAVYSRLRFFGIRAAGPALALAGGLLAALSLAGSGVMLWMLSRPGTLENPSLVSAFYDLMFVLGGPAHLAGLGLLLLGVSIPAGIYRLIPRWTMVLGIVAGTAAELSTLTLLTFKASYLLPARFPAAVWMIAVAISLPSWKPRGSMEA